MNNTTETAEAAYSRKSATALDQLRRIAELLSEHQTRQEARPEDWGYVADVGRVNEELARVLASLGDQ
jgi:hypothetical protein